MTVKKQYFLTAPNRTPVHTIFLSFEAGSSRSPYVEESFWRRLWTCRQTEYWISEWY